MLVPSTDVNDRRSPRLEGPVGGDGRGCGAGELGSRLVTPAPMGDGSAGARDDVGELWAGREGSEGPLVREDCCLKDVEGECTEGEPDIVPDLNGLTGLNAGRRKGTGPGES